MTTAHKKQLAALLMIALGIIYIQVIVGGITRLTGSGLSITKWDIVTGTLPPLNAAQWQEEFDLYQESPQYKEVNTHMQLTDFKYIYFWEWLHRVWGRWGFVFILGIFAYMWFKKRLDNIALKRFVVFLLLYAAQGALGWFMVASGLVDVPRVSHYRLTAHLGLAIFLFAFLLWWVVDLLTDKRQRVKAFGLHRFIWFLVGLTIVQIAFGGFMSGLRAATSYPTWPDMNNEWLPATLLSMEPIWLNIVENHATIQFIHRGIAYVLLALIVRFWFLYRKQAPNNSYFTTGVNALLMVTIVQVSLGITVLLLSASGTIPVSFGVAHQAVGLLLLSNLLFVAFQTEKLELL